MPNFHLTPTISVACPQCRTQATVAFIMGRQVLKCNNCEATMSFEFPPDARGAFDKVIGLVKQMESKIEEMIFPRR
jgi:hypothetical protein